MVTQQRMILKWLSFKRPQAQGEPASDAETYPKWKRHDRDSLPFWRRLLCAPEVGGYSAPTTNLSEADTCVSSQTFAGEMEIDDNCGPKLKSVFAEPRRQSRSLSHDGYQPLAAADKFRSCLNSKEQCSSLGSCARWVVTDTRRMHFTLDGVSTKTLTPSSSGSTIPSIPLTSTVSSSAPSPSQSPLPPDDDPLRQQRKEEQKAQLVAEQRRRRELQRDEQMLLEEERNRISRDTLQTPGQLTEENLSRHVRASANMAPSGDRSAGWNDTINPLKSLSSYNDDSSTYIDCDDVIDLHELDRLFEYCKRREKTAASAEEAEVPLGYSNADHSVAHDSGCSTISTVVQPLHKPKQQQRYPLGSRRYIERIVLAEHSQQVVALMWLLAESMRHAWRLQLRLAQLYTYYVPTYLQAESARRAASAGAVGVNAVEDGHVGGCGCGNPNDEVFGITRNKYYAYFCSGSFDYEYYVYQFNQEWGAIFAAVKNYLEPTGSTAGTTTVNGVESVGCEGPAPRGSVCFVAALLYSMSLFERQWELQVAVREVEQWAKKCWSRLNQAPATESDGKKISSSPFGETQILDGGNDDGEEIEVAWSKCQKEPKDDEAKDEEEEHEDEESQRIYLPMDWWRAQDTDVQVQVSWNRRRRKMRQIRISTAALQKVRCLENAPPVATSLYHAPSVAEPLPVTLEALPNDRSDEEPDSHHVVNVGCFGFSFFSPWD